MDWQITEGSYYVVDTEFGGETVPMELVGYIHPELMNSLHAKGRILPFIEAACSDGIHTIELVEGFGARLSMPGHLDCTPWMVFDTYHEAQEYLMELSGVNN